MFLFLSTSSLVGCELSADTSTVDIMCSDDSDCDVINAVNVCDGCVETIISRAGDNATLIEEAEALQSTCLAVSDCEDFTLFSEVRCVETRCVNTAE